MKIEVMEIDRQGPNKDQTTVFGKIEDEIVVEVQGFGTGEYRWKVHVQRLQANNTYDQQATERALDGLFAEHKDAEGYYGPGALGPGAVYFEPKTFTHAVFDVIRNA